MNVEKYHLIEYIRTLAGFWFEWSKVKEQLIFLRKMKNAYKIAHVFHFKKNCLISRFLTLNNSK